MTAAPHQCWACHRTAQVGTPAEATAVEPHLCPRCDHDYALSLTGGAAVTHPFTGVDSPAYTAPEAPAPAPLPEPSPVPGDAPFDVELASEPVVFLPWELGFVPELPESYAPLVRCEPAALERAKAVA